MDRLEMVLIALMEDVADMRRQIRAKMNEIEYQGAVDIKMYALYSVEYVTLTNIMELIAGYRRENNA